MVFDWSRVIALVLQILLEQLTPEIRTLMCNALKSLHAKAKQTPNPVDQIFTEMLLELTKCPKE